MYVGIRIAVLIWQKVTETLLNHHLPVQSSNKKDMSKTTVKCSSAFVNKSEETLDFVSMFWLSFLTSKSISAKVLTVFQGQYAHRIIVQPIRQLQWSATKVTLESLIFFLLNNKGAIRTGRKIHCFLLYHFHIVVTIFRVARSLLICSITRPSFAH